MRYPMALMRPSAAMRDRVRPLRLLVVDLLDSVLGRRPDFVPPRREVEKIGGFDFLEIGDHLATIAKTLGELQPHERVLDVGCGLGRLAVGLRGYLSCGEYDGFDISKRGIQWCRNAIESKWPNFHFTLVDVCNHHYNVAGACPAEGLVFPYASNSVDLAFASSLFTHLRPAAADRYLAEISRVLKPGGRFVGSFFLLNGHSRPLLPELTPRFVPVEPYFAVQNPHDFEAAVAFDEEAVRAALSRHGIPVEEILYGGWSMRSEYLSFQDFILTRKA